MAIKEHQKKNVWHTTKGEYRLSHMEQVLLADEDGFHLVRYDKHGDFWIDDNGNQLSGGKAFLTLPSPSEAIDEAYKRIKGEPFAKL